MNKLILTGLGRRFGTFDKVTFPLSLAEGELVSLLGPSGCGKTTLRYRFHPPDHQMIEVNGATISSPDYAVPPEKRGMSMIFQSYAIWPNMVGENVAFGLKAANSPLPTSNVGSTASWRPCSSTG